MELVKFQSILGHQNVVNGGSKHTVYFIEVLLDKKPCVVQHRYHDFKELHSKLTSEGYTIQALPPKKFIGSFNPEFLSKRQHDLSAWLGHLTKDWDNMSQGPNPEHSDALRLFLLKDPQAISKELVKELQGVDSMFSFQEAECTSPNDTDVTEFYDTPKFTLNDFELLKVVGKGSYGKVTLVKKKDTGQLFAMKSLSKPNVKRRNQVEHTRTERRVLGKAKHPFIVHLHYAFQTKNKLYFVLDYCPGGELFFHLSKMEKFPEHMARFYAAEITLALGRLHELGVVYRDLKPENILFDGKGHVRLADFGLAKEGIKDGKAGTNSMCGTPEYLSPEIIDRVGHGTAVDWWAMGMVLYEMLTGLPPWYTKNRTVLFDRVRNAPLKFPGFVSDPAQNLIRGLLDRNPATRLGSKDTEDVKKHAFFKGVDWKALYDLKIPPPFNPCQNGDLATTKNFDAEFTSMNIHSVSDSNMGSARASDARGSLTFQGFTYNTPNEMQAMGGSAPSQDK